MEHAYRYRTVNAWLMMAELCRRHADTTLIHGWGHNVWDRLMLEDAKGEQTVIVSINSSLIPLDPSGAGMSWLTLAALGPRQSALRVEEIVGMAVPRGTPSTTPKTLSYRTLACLCAYSLGTVTFLNPRWGVFWDEEEDHPEEEYFAAVPHCQSHRRSNTPAGPKPTLPPRQLEAGYWFLVPWRNRTRSGRETGTPVPVAAVHVDGLLWVGDEPAVNLVDLYNRRDRDFALFMNDVAAIFGDQLEFLT